MEGFLVSAATGALKAVLQKLSTLMGDEYKLLTGVRDEIRFLMDELTSMHAFLRVMSEEEHPSVQDHVWMTAVRELSYDMEDSVDGFMHSVDDKDTKPDGFMEKIKHSIRKLGKMKTHHQIGKEIQDLKKQIIEVGDRNGRYKVGNMNESYKSGAGIPSTNSVTVDPRALAIFEHASELIGIDKPKAELIKMLTEHGVCASMQGELKIVSIVGPGGMGKTTLANQVYLELRGQFECQAFLSVSRNPNMMNIMRTILSEVSMQPYAETETGSIQQLISKINNFLVDKRYFIVVDDIWKVETWDVLKCVFPKSIHGSMIITTTRMADVADSCCSSFNGHVYNIRPLGMWHSRELFNRRLFNSEEHCPLYLEDISYQILKKCDGLPLAIIAISGLLASKERTMDIWNQVIYSIGRALERNHSVESMMRILSLSYFDLPPHLKSCLLYLAIFPEDTIIEKKCLIRRWIAEGLIYKEGRYTVHELGEMCFNELVNRNLVQLVNDQYYKRISCRVHDTILDFIISKSIEDNFLTFVGVPFLPINSKRKVRRLSLQVGTDGNYILPASMVLSHTRSLNVFGVPGEVLPLNEFRRLRILNFGGCSHYYWKFKLTNNHIKGIGRLLHLRHLNLRGAQITHVPGNIGCLRSIEMLDLRGNNLRELPASIVNLRKLVHLLIDTHVKFPDGFGKLQALEVLKWVGPVVQKYNFMQQLGQLWNLRRLSIDAHRFVSSSHVLVSLDKLHHLKIKNGGKFFSTGTLCPVPLSLHKLILKDSPFSKVPKWMPSLVNLQELRIEVEGITQNDLCILGSLPALLRLEVKSICLTLQDTLLTISGEVGFSYLTKFQYSSTHCRGMDLKFTEGSMPNLEMLVIFLDPYVICEACHFDFGINNLPSLFTLECRVNGYSSSFESAMKSAASTHPNRPTVLFPVTSRFVSGAYHL